MKTKIIYSRCIIVLLIFAALTGNAQIVENQFQTRAELGLSYKLFKKMKLSVSPKIRFSEDFSVDEFLIEGKIDYKASKLITLDAAYRFIGNIRDTKDTEYFNRFAFSATVEKKFDRFEPSFRLRYSNYADDDVNDKNFLRYKAALNYDIKNCKITPFIAAEAFQQLNDGGLYKMRYSTGFDYKLFKNNYIGASYKFDYYQTEYLNKHIVGIQYKIKF